MAWGNSNFLIQTALLDEWEDEVDNLFYSEEKVYKNILQNSHAIVGRLLLRESHPKFQGFVDVIEKISDLDFFKLFRVTKNTFLQLTDSLTPYFTQSYDHGGRVPIVTKVIVWPKLRDITKVESEFGSLSNFSRIIGAIDGCHIKIKAPEEYQKDYLDRTMNHSVNLLAVCDSEKRFTFIYAGFPGSAHDQRVLSQSVLGKTLERDSKEVCYSDKYHIIGDSAFSLKKYMMVPFKDCGDLDARHLLFNNRLSVSRRVIENSFAWLKGIFRRLKYIDADLCRNSKIITAACVLHNITIANTEELDFLLNELDVNEEDEMEVVLNPLRNDIMRNLSL